MAENITPIEQNKNAGEVLLQSYISKQFVSLTQNNGDVVQISTERLTSEGDIFTVDERVITPNLIKTTGSIQELQPEVSDVYPYKVVTPTDENGSTIIYSQTVDTPVTASQNYYTPIYFERYDANTVRLIDRQFTELTIPEAQ